MRFDDYQLALLKQRYLFPGETPAGMFRRVARYIGVEESETLMNEGKFMPNSPTLMNAGREGLSQLSACFVLPIYDSIDSIYDTLKHTAKIHQSGGGTGFNFSNLRPRGDLVSRTKGVASGPVSFLRVYDVGTEVVKQGGLRRGANMGMLRVNHPDIRDFLVCKTQEGQIRNFNISVSIDDKFMDALQGNRDYDLINPRTGEVWETVGAREIWDKMIAQTWNNGEPGFFFVDTVNKFNPHPELGKLEACNPCVSGDTQILTDKGYFPIRDLVGLPVNVWNGEEFSQVVPRITGKDQPMLKITFSNGHVLRCTYNHTFYLKGGKKIKAINLQVGDKLQKWNLPVIEGTKSESRTWAYTRGFFSGDGYAEQDGRRRAISLYGEKRDLVEYLEYKTANVGEERIVLEMDRDAGYDKNFVPDATYTVKTRLDWLAGLIDSDGSNADKGVYISSVNLEFLQNVQRMLEQTGCKTTLAKGHAPGPKEFKGKTYECQQEYRLVLSSYELHRLVGLGLKTHRVTVNFGQPNRDASRFIGVTGIEFDGVEDTVYCFTEPKRHRGCFNGIVTGQCGETPLLPYESCVLGSVNLANHVLDDGSDYDWEGLEHSVRVGVDFLNNVIDRNQFPIPEIEEATKRTNKIGLGVMGWADSLIKLGIRYDDKEALKLADQVMGFIQEKSHDQSDGRNMTVTTIAPTGSISIICNCSSGIEPNFAKVETRNQFGTTYTRKHPLLGQYDEDLFVMAHDVTWAMHVAHQATFQKHVDNAISKTINLPATTSMHEVEIAVRTAYNMGCKGVTLYRDRSRKEQVIVKECEHCSV